MSEPQPENGPDACLAAFGGATALAKELQAPISTVHSWKLKGRIPHWRRAQVEEAARRRDIRPDPAWFAQSSDEAPTATPSRAAQ
jgi:hypothetical protein